MLTRRDILRMGLVAAIGAAPTPLLAAGKRRRRPGFGFVPTAPRAPFTAHNLRGETFAALRIVEPGVSITLHGCTDVRISACELRSVLLVNCSNIRIAHCFLHDADDPAVHLDSCSDIHVQGNRIERCSSGLYAHRCDDASGESGGVRFIGNYVQDVTGPMPRGQMAQLDQCTGAGHVICDNYARNLFGRSRPEDVINLHRTTGTAESPVLVQRNYIAGDPVRGTQGMSDSGSGIMLGDGGGGAVLCSDNVLINPGQVGIGVAGGGDIVVRNNRVLGRPSDVSNVGIYAWNQYEAAGRGAVTIEDNVVHWQNRRGDDNAFWNGGGFTTVVARGNRWDDVALLTAIPRPPSAAPFPPKPIGERASFPWR